MTQIRAIVTLAVGTLIATALGGCATSTVRTTTPVALQHEAAEILEGELLDVAVTPFDPGLKEEKSDEAVFPEVRKAESLYIAHTLSQTLQRSAGWGGVRVIPGAQSSADVVVSGEILRSDGESLAIRATVRDASGRVWFSRRYETQASRYAYAEAAPGVSDPFQDVYNRIANDMLAYRRGLAGADLEKLRRISELRFAQVFAPEAFAGHLKDGGGGDYELVRLPAADDPMMERVRRIRDRDQLFADTLQNHYGLFAQQMQGPYQEWRGQSYREIVARRELERSARNRQILGAAAILAGILAAGSSDNYSVQQAGTIGVIGGAYVFKTGLDKKAESKIHVEALKELGDSMEAEMQPQVMEIEDRTVTLTGSVENQYQQWREILREIYVTETGRPVSMTP